MNATSSAFPNREAVADKLTAFGGEEQAWLSLVLENPQQDESLLEGLLFFLDRASQARFLN